ncbi:MAG: insulinase family protein [Eubacterium sp.]|nr:insulinase family protein [Eubacterium sp.]
MYDAYEVIRTEEITDVHAAGTLLVHKKSGARVALLSNDDENKVFYIGFRTPPVDSTGVAHIIEHSVLCGSRKYPVKDPFVELIKGSLNTFLNAMTYPDKTVYPVASCNDADFKNLCDVYMDAVLHPNIYSNDKIFRQEGWHYHLENKEDPLTFNGVVYNEMKGAFSSAEAVLDREVFSALFPDTAYGVESGGDPEVIPELTYEEFLNFHKRYYHPSNSYIYFYGNCDMEERLEWLDKAYLNEYDRIEIDSELTRQASFETPKEVFMTYPVLDEEPVEDNTYLCSASVVCDGLDNLSVSAFSVLENVLLTAPGAPVKQALLDAGIGKDISGGFSDGILQPFFTVEAKYANAEDKDRFVEVIRETLTQICREGIDELALRSAIHFYEFRFREADFASFPKGLMYGAGMLDTWLYDDDKPFDGLKQLAVFDELKKRIGTGYYEQLIADKLLGNPHSVIMVLSPEKGLAARKEEKLAKKLEAYKKSLSDEELDRIAAETEALRLFQEAEDSPEDLAAIPRLSISDIDRKTPVKLNTEEMTAAGTRILYHSYDTNGIAYLTLFFDVKNVPDEWTEYLSFLKSVLGSVSTARYGYNALFNHINARTGGISCGLQAFTRKGQEDLRVFGVRSKYLYGETAFLFEMIKEILFTSVLDDEKRLYEILSSVKAQLSAFLPASGHTTAVGIAQAGLTPMGGWQERIGGYAYYRFIDGLSAHFDERKEELIRILKEICSRVFTRENLVADITAEKEGLEKLKAEAESFAAALPEKCEEKGGFVWEKSDCRKAVKTAGQVQFAAAAGNFRQKGYEYTGALRVLKPILSFDYLWTNLRVKGGAYGCMSAFRRTGEAMLVSYRDPHLAATYDVYKGIPAFLESFEADERTMTGYIISAISKLDTPMNPSAKGALAVNAWYMGLTEADFQKERDEVLAADNEKIRALAALVRDSIDFRHICVVGSEAAIEKHADMFDDIESFVQA